MLAEKDNQIFIALLVPVIVVYGLYSLATGSVGFIVAVALNVALLVWSLQPPSLDDADDAYYNKGEPIMSDAEYDAQRANQPKYGVGAPVSGGEKHTTRMLSLSNAIDRVELRDFFDSVTAKLGTTSFIIEPKIDGLAMNLTYEDGELLSAVTRGDGESGKDVTEKVRCFVPESIERGNCEIRGEVYVEKSRLVSMNKARKSKGNAEYKTCQSAAVATLMHESSSVCRARRLKFVAYDMGIGKDDYKTQSSVVLALKKLGFDVLNHSKIRTFDGVMRACKRIFAQSEYPADGSVVKVDDINSQTAMGVTKQCPIWAIAYKGKK